VESCDSPLHILFAVIEKVEKMDLTGDGDGEEMEI
jgi:hypothetical protein